MTGFLQLWDRVELWLATLPFALQVAILLVMGLPLFLLAAVAVEWIADVLVQKFRALVASRTAETGKEVR
ncbi:hypothetical protein [Dietzia sp. CH92]|uniref:hypothetical protein n=1 Tax=Dietzia sp. CH92 TaxID=3051823 RepID=UPI0028D6E867|nr:hypothetical protein [Dietzia sp. CH92]